MRVAKWARAGHQMVVVPSAMSGETNRLLGLAKELMPEPERRRSALRELDAVAATGEQVSVGLLALALQAQGLQAVSYGGWQVPIATDSAYTKARIAQHRRRPRARRPGRRQGRRHHRLPGHRPRRPRDDAGPRRQRHLGGGDGGGAEGRRVPDLHRRRRRLHHRPAHRSRSAAAGDISFEEMLEMASLGSKVLQIRSVEFAGKYRVPVRVLSSFTPWDIPIEEEAQSGTLITFEEDEKMEQAVVAGIAFNRDEAKISVIGVPDKPGIALPDPGAGGRRQHRRRRDHPERVARRPHRLLVHRAPQRLPADAGRAGSQGAAGHRRCRGQRRPEDLQGRRSSASACAATSAWPARCSAR